MNEAIKETHFRIVASDWVSLICSIDSKYPSEDLGELFSEVAAAPLTFGETTSVTCYKEERERFRDNIYRYEG